MLERPKRTKKVSIQDRIQPTTVEELIRKYDLDNKKIYEYLDYLVEYLNDKKIDINDIENIVQEKVSPIDITDQYTTNYKKKYFKALYYPLFRKVEIYFSIDEIAKSTGFTTIASTLNNNYKNVEEHYDVAYGSAAQLACILITGTGDLQVYSNSGAITLVSGRISFVLKDEEVAE